MLQSCLTKQLIETNVLLFIEPERVFVTRSFRLLCSFLGGIHSFGLKGVRLGRTPGLAERAPLYAEKFFGIQRYSLLASSEAKNPRRKNFRKIYAKPPLRLPRVGRFPLQYYNHAGAKTNPRYGLERSGADIGTEVFQSVVSCSMKGKFSYSVHYPDINCIKQKTVF